MITAVTKLLKVPSQGGLLLGAVWQMSPTMCRRAVLLGTKGKTWSQSIHDLDFQVEEHRRLFLGTDSRKQARLQKRDHNYYLTQSV